MTRLTGLPEEPETEIPEDVAILYSWAKLPGATYRDFSRPRREYRAQVRQRAAESMRQAALRATAVVESAALQAAQAAGDAERLEAGSRGGTGERALWAAEETLRRAAAEREEAERRAEAAVQAEAAARQVARELAEARVPAERRGERQGSSEVLRRSRAGPQPVERADAGGQGVGELARELARNRGVEEDVRGLGGVAEAAEDGGLLRERGPAGVWEAPGRPVAVPQAAAVVAAGPLRTREMLEHAPDQMASRWFALREVSHGEARGGRPERVESGGEGEVPLLVVFSLAGGVGKTSLVAALGRALSSQGERVLLADLTLQGLLPYYFGASESRAGVVRRFSPPAGSRDAPISLVSYGAEEHWEGEKGLLAELGRSGHGAHRMLLDVDAGSVGMLRQLGSTQVTMLVPLTPDMNTVISLPRVERSFARAAGGKGEAIVPYYVLNGLEGSQPLHVEVREVLRGRLGERLLPVAIRRSAAVSEALAEGMTVLDYAPEDLVAEDYRRVAGWLRGVSAAAAGPGGTRWREG